MIPSEPNQLRILALGSIYGCSNIMLLILKKKCYTTKSAFQVLAYYTTSSIHGGGETTAAGAHTSRWAAIYFRLVCGLHYQLASNCPLMESKRLFGVDVDTYVSCLPKQMSIG